MVFAEQREEVPWVGEAAVACDESDRFVRRYEQMARVADTELNEQFTQTGAQVRAEQALDR